MSVGRKRAGDWVVRGFPVVCQDLPPLPPSLASSHSPSHSRTAAPPARPRAAVIGDLHVYDPGAAAWADLSSPASGGPPFARAYHGFASAEGRLYVHGGRDMFGERTMVQVGTEGATVLVSSCLRLHPRDGEVGREQPGVVVT